MLDLLCASQRQSLRSLSRPRANERKSSSYPKTNDVRKFNEFIMLEEKWAWDTSRTPANVAASSSLHRRFSLGLRSSFSAQEKIQFSTQDKFAENVTLRRIQFPLRAIGVLATPAMAERGRKEKARRCK